MMWNPCGSGYGMMYSGNWWFVALQMLFGLLVFIGLIILIVWAIKSFAGESRSAVSGTTRALDELKLRLARGEIDEETYDRLKRKLLEER